VLSDEPDLMRELDEAEEIVTGRLESVVTEWGVRYQCPPGLDQVDSWGSDEADARRGAAGRGYGRLGGVLVRRTVTYGPWEEVPGE
jgi:hypothetical protein